MKVRIAESIRAMRKERKLTQEQLAEAMGVTIGAVSKWESGASMPDIGLIAELANFFETSVDVLLGYDWRAGSMGQSVERIKSLRNEKRFDKGTTEAEKALLKYPNTFDVVYQCAILYSMKGVERRCHKSFTRAQELFDRSLELIAQNNDEHINEWTIRNNIADTYLCLGQTDKALEQMKRNNANGLNDGDIGYTLATNHRDDEALPYLSDALISYVANLHRTMVAYFNVYVHKEDFASALAVFCWMRGLISSLHEPGKTTYLDMMEIQLLTGIVYTSVKLGDMDGAKKSLRQAVRLARAYDENPSYSFSGMRFYYSKKDSVAFDDFGETAMAGLRRVLCEDEDSTPLTSKLWDEVAAETGDN